MCESFIPKFLDKYKKHGKEWEWHEGELKAFLVTEMKRPQPKPLLLLIDALDECNESEVRAVVSFLELLSINAINSNTMLNICLSSRHYPHVSMKLMLELTVEREGRHNLDIARYVQSQLRVRDKEIEQELLQKAENIFMWVVLVVEIINNAFDEGEVRAMKEKLRKIPSDLDEVFLTLLSKDNPKKQETALMLQWVLFTGRLLQPEELYFAVLAGSRTEELGAWDQSTDTPELIKRFINSTSKGLVEVRKGDKETVQFIHETVKDFLLRNKRLQTLDPMLEQHPIGTSHDRLAACCMSYIMIKELELLSEGMSNTESDDDFRALLKVKYPFLEYSTIFILYHADKALEGGVSQQALLRQVQQSQKGFKRFKSLYDISQQGSVSGRIGDAGFLYTVSLNSYYELVLAVLKEGIDVNVQGGYYGNALQAACSRGSDVVVKLLLENGADVNASGGRYGNALQAASSMGQHYIFQQLQKARAMSSPQRDSASRNHPIATRTRLKRKRGDIGEDL